MFKVGDKVRAKSKTYPGFSGIPDTGDLYINRIDKYDTPVCYVCGTIQSNGYGNFYREEDLELINNKTNMSVKEKFLTAFLAEPEKTFRKKGITNGDGFLTQEGQEVFMAYLLKKYGADFKKEVVDEMKEDE